MMKNLLNIFLVFVAATCSKVACASDVSVTLKCGDGKSSCAIIIGESLNLTIVQTATKSVDIAYDFLYSAGNILLKEPRKNGKLLFGPLPALTLTGNETKVVLIETTKGNDTAGQIRVALNATTLSLKMPVIDVTITRNSWLKVFGTIVGWIYFLAWSVSFYPQCYINFKRKSVIGLNFDFISLNVTGFTCYAIYNLCLFYNSEVREEYFKKYPLGVIQVEPNDIFFALHATTLTLITIVQCFLYERGEQSVSKFCRALLLGMFLFAIVSLILAGASAMDWLTFVDYLSYLKLFITVIKYIPQAYMNYKRKSTDGWSIGNILCDFTGGSLSILQMFLKAYNYDDWKSIFGNVTKFGLGFFSVLFDILFILQHYVFYRQSVPYDEIINGNRVRNI